MPHDTNYLWTLSHFRLKEIAQNDKQELAQVQKVNKELNQKLSTLGGDRDKLQERLQEAEGQIDELKEQVSSPQLHVQSSQ